MYTKKEYLFKKLKTGHAFSHFSRTYPLREKSWKLIARTPCILYRYKLN